MRKFWFLFIISIISINNINSHPNVIIIKNNMDLLENPAIRKYMENHSEWFFQKQIRIQPISFSFQNLIFYLDCEAESPEFIKDESGNYRIIKKNIFLYRYTQKELHSLKIGYRSKEHACLFRKRNHKILIETAGKTWNPSANFFSKKENRDFSISFWFRPFIFLREQTLLDWSSYTGQEVKKFRILLKKGNLILEIQNIIYDSNQKVRNIQVRIARRNVISIDQWNHIFLSFSAQRGMILIFVNQKNKKIITLPKYVQFDFSSIHHPPIQIGGNFIGLIDELYILNTFYSHPITFYNYTPFQTSIRSGRIFQKPKSLLFPIIKLPERIKALKIKIQYQMPKETLLKFEYRSSSSLEHISTSKWNSLYLESNHTKKTFVLKRFVHIHPFIQFRIRMLWDSEGFMSPIISHLQLIPQPYQKPETPQNVRIIPELSNSNQVCLEWKKLPQEEIEEKGGYQIHIGVKPKEYQLILRKLFRNQHWIVIKKRTTDFPLTEEEKQIKKIRPLYWKQYQNNHIRIILTQSDLYRFYEEKAKSGSLKTIPLIFEPEMIYYFRISSYIGVPSIHSELSRFVTYSFNNKKSP